MLAAGGDGDDVAALSVLEFESDCLRTAYQFRSISARPIALGGDCGGINAADRRTVRVSERGRD